MSRIEVIRPAKELNLLGQYHWIGVTPENLPMFQQLIHRGANLWPDAPPEIKEFADVITNGYAMQDYFGNPNLAGKGKPLNADKKT